MGISSTLKFCLRIRYSSRSSGPSKASRKTSRASGGIYSSWGMACSGSPYKRALIVAVVDIGGLRLFGSFVALLKFGIYVFVPQASAPFSLALFGVWMLFFITVQKLGDRGLIGFGHKRPLKTNHKSKWQAT